MKRVPLAIGPSSFARSSGWRIALVLLGCGALFGLAACGASIQAVYEGDVRFEHCMALDAEPEVRPAIRRACWSEWVSFYTYGQTRDRVRHAQMRIRRLSGLPEPGEAGGLGADPLGLPPAPATTDPAGIPPSKPAEPSGQPGAG